MLAGDSYGITLLYDGELLYGVRFTRGSPDEQSAAIRGWLYNKKRRQCLHAVHNINIIRAVLQLMCRRV